MKYLIRGNKEKDARLELRPSCLSWTVGTRFGTSTSVNRRLIFRHVVVRSKYRGANAAPVRYQEVFMWRYRGEGNQVEVCSIKVSSVRGRGIGVSSFVSCPKYKFAYVTNNVV